MSRYRELSYISVTNRIFQWQSTSCISLYFLPVSCTQKKLGYHSGDSRIIAKVQAVSPCPSQVNNEIMSRNNKYKNIKCAHCCYNNEKRDL